MAILLLFLKVHVTDFFYPNQYAPTSFRIHHVDAFVLKKFIILYTTLFYVAVRTLYKLYVTGFI